MTIEQSIKAKTDEALRALQAARAINEEFAGSAMPADKQEAFEKAMADFATAHGEIEALKKRQATEEQLAAHLADYTQARETFAHKAPSATLSAEEQAAKAHHEAFRRYLYQGTEGLTREEFRQYIVNPAKEQQALVSTVDNLGGFLVPEVTFNELIREVAGFAVMRPLARVRRTTSQVGNFLTVTGGTDPKKMYSSGVSGSWRQEGYVQGGAAPPTQDQPHFGKERVQTHIWQPPVIELTIDLLEDASVDLEAEIRMLLAETKALDEDSAFINGTGVGHPEGLMTGLAGVSTIKSGVQDGQSYDGIVNLFTGLPAQYRSRATWLMNSLTYGLLLLVKDQEERPLFPVNQLINQLLGRPIAISEFMPDGDDDDNKPIVFGDFSYYGVVDRRDLRVQRLVERYAPNIGIIASARTGGQLLKTAPFVVQKVGA